MDDSFTPASKSQKFIRLKAEILREFKDIERCCFELKELLGMCIPGKHFPLLVI